MKRALTAERSKNILILLSALFDKKEISIGEYMRMCNIPYFRAAQDFVLVANHYKLFAPTEKFPKRERPRGLLSHTPIKPLRVSVEVDVKTAIKMLRKEEGCN